MNILVTGGTGFIGSHIVLELLASGYVPVILDNFHNSAKEITNTIKLISGQSVECIEADIKQASQLHQVFSQHQIDGVIHLAALKSVEESVREPVLYYENNLGGLINLIKAMSAHNCYKLVFSSSATVFGIPAKLPIEEDAPLQSTNPYGSSKIACEYLLQDLAGSDDSWQIISLRYFNPAGAHSSGLLGEMPSQAEPSNLFPAIIHSHRNPGSVFKVFGDDYDTRDGTCIRDYLHIMDLASAHTKALEKLKEAQGYKVINLGSGQGWTVLEVIRGFERVSGAKLPYKIMPRRSGDVAANYTSTRCAKEFLNWQTTRGLDSMWQDSLRFTAQPDQNHSKRAK